MRLCFARGYVSRRGLALSGVREKGGRLTQRALGRVEVDCNDGLCAARHAVDEQLADAAAAAGDEDDLVTGAAPRVRGPVVEDELGELVVDCAREAEGEERLDPREGAGRVREVAEAQGEQLGQAVRVVEHGGEEGARHCRLQRRVLDRSEHCFEGEALAGEES